MAVTDRSDGVRPPAPARARGAGHPRLLRAGALAVAALCALPMAAVFLAAFGAGPGTVALLAQTVLPGYAANTLALMLGVGFGTALIGTGTAWLVTAHAFPGRRLLEILLVLPLAFPAYVMAYAYTDLLDHPGLVQSTLRAVTGWGPRDYWFPEIRSLGGAMAMLTLVLYPYVYLLARASFAHHGTAAFLTARTLGQGPWTALIRAVLPIARPAIAAGVLLAVMETIADYGTVSFFGVRTFATGIYVSWFSMADRAAAAQLALCLLGAAFALALLERTTRGAARFDTGTRRQAGGGMRIPLTGWRGAAASLACAAPVLFGCVLPAVVLFSMGLGSEQDLLSDRYRRFIANSLTLAGIAALLTVAAAIVVSYHRRIRDDAVARGALQVARLGYAVPGGVIAVGLLVPLAAFDNALDTLMETWFGLSTGLLFTGSIWLLMAAYMIRFLAAAIGAYESGQSTINDRIDAAARSLGATPYATLRRVHLPLLRPSLLTALLIVFVDVMKELPATLIMRPFNFDTLAVQAHRLASDERLNGAAVPSLVIVAVGLIPVILLCRSMARQR